MDLAVFDWHRIGYTAGKLVAAYLLALPIGWEREAEAHYTGVRTFPLVAMASCGYVLLALPATNGSVADTQSRIIQGLVAGIGFIGGGAILKTSDTVKGTATAASIWNTGVIGAAVAQGQYEIAVVLSLLNLITLRFLLPVKVKLDRSQSTEEK